MKKLFIVVSLLVSSAIYAAPEDVLDVGVNFAVRDDYLRFNIAGNNAGTSPNILSELTYDDIRSLQVEGYLKSYFENSLYLEGSFAFGRVFDGESQDSDYFGDNRTQEFSRSYSDIKGDGSYDLSVGVGYQFGSSLDAEKGSGFRLIPKVGYAVNTLNIRVKNGVQVVNTLSSFLGPFDGLNTTYEAKWKGPWVGLRGEFDVSHSVGFFVDAAYHLMEYKAVADWNLRDDFQHPKSFLHTADGDGGSIAAGIRFAPSKSFTMQFTASYTEATTDHGVDATYFSDNTTLTTRLNEVKWKSAVIMFSPKFTF